jgi:hypothetical protein
MQAAIIEQLRSFEEFDADNDPDGYHNGGRFEHCGRTILWHIDLDERGYYWYKPDPADPAQHNFVLASEPSSQGSGSRSNVPSRANLSETGTAMCRFPISGLLTFTAIDT